MTSDESRSSTPQWRPGRAAMLALVLLVVAGAHGAQALGRDVTFRFLEDDRGRLIAVVSSEGLVTEYAYDDAGERRVVDQFAVDPFAIIRVEPLDAPAGARIEIHGQGFGPESSDNQVRFDGLAARVLRASETLLEVEVPAGARSGAISVQRGAKRVDHHAAFTVTLPPVLSSIEPALVASSGDFPTHLIGVELHGRHLHSTTLEFVSQKQSDAIEIVSSRHSPDGSSLRLDLRIAQGANDRFELVARNSAGSSRNEEAAIVTLTVIPASLDSDGDRITDFHELQACTSVESPDTDADGFSDLDELELDADPCDGEVIPGGAIASFTTTSGPALSFVSHRFPQIASSVEEGFGVALGGSLTVLNRVVPAIELADMGASSSTGETVAVTSGPALALLNQEDPPRSPYGGEQRFVSSAVPLSVFNATWREGAEDPVILPAQYPPPVLIEQSFASMRESPE